VDIRAVTAEVKALRADLASSQAALTAAVTALTTVASNLTTNNVAWRRDALEKTVAAISAVPSQLAQDSSLREALLIGLTSSVGAKLSTDATFIDAIRKPQ